jgi:hypothetical protein
MTTEGLEAFVDSGAGSGGQGVKGGVSTVGEG